MRNNAIYNKKFSLVSIFAVLAAIAFAVSLLPILYASFYAHPISDDFNYSKAVHDAVAAGGGFWEVVSASFGTIAKYYRTWQGTFFSILVFSLQPSAFSDDLYFLTTFIMVFSLSLSTFFLLDTIIVKLFKSKRSYSVLISALLLLSSLQFMPNIPEGLYWFNGSSYYTFSYAVALSFFAVLIRLHLAESRTKRFILFAASIFLAFCVGGTNYSTALSSLCVFVVILGCLIIKKERKLKYYYVVALVLLVSFLVNVAAPGNAVRAASTSGTSPVIAVLRSVRESWGIMSRWTKMPQIVIFAAICPLIYKISKKSGWKFEHPFIVCVLAFLLYATQLTPPIYAMGWSGAGRARDMYYYAYHLCVVFVMFYLCGYIHTRKLIVFEKTFVSRLSTKLIYAAVLLFLLVDGCYKTGFDKLTSVKVADAVLTGTTFQYEIEYWNIIEAVKNGEKVVSDIGTIPKDVFMPFAFGESEYTWTNQAVANYYDVEFFEGINVYER